MAENLLFVEVEIRPYIYLRASQSSKGDLRLRLVQAGPGGGHTGRCGRQGHACRDAHWRRQEPLLSGACADAGEPDGDSLAPDLTDERSGRLLASELGLRCGHTSLWTLARGALGGRAEGANGGGEDALRGPRAAQITGVRPRPPARRRRSLCCRRSPLYLGGGPQFTPGLLVPASRSKRPGQSSSPRPYSNGDSACAARYLALAEDALARGGRNELQSPEPDLQGHPSEGEEVQAATHTRRHTCLTAARDRLRHDAQGVRGTRRRPAPFR